MADPTVPWGIPLFDDNTPFAPIQAPFNSQSAALNDALTAGAFQPYATKALLDAAPGTRVGQHATVYGDGTAAYNGDYRWSGSAWIANNSGLINPTLTSPWTAVAGEVPGYQRINGVVHLSGRCSTTTSSSNKPFVLPAGFKPLTQVVCMAEVNGTSVRSYITLDGTVGPIAAGVYPSFSLASMPAFVAAP